MGRRNLTLVPLVLEGGDDQVFGRARKNAEWRIVA